MFRKIVSQLSFSPALVSQLAFYARRLRKEQTTRRLGLIFVALALVVQSLVVFQPPESANASNTNDFVPGGLGVGADRSLDNFLKPYDANSKHLKDIFDFYGITRSEITNSEFGYFAISGDTISWGHEPRPSGTKVDITNDNGKVVTSIYGSPLTTRAPAGTKIYGWIGHSEKWGWFAIMQSCGNLVTKEFKPEPADLSFSKTAKNVTQGDINATKNKARAGDRIRFDITAKNTGGTAKTIDMNDDLSDVLQYSTLVDKGGGDFNQNNQTLSWNNINVRAGASITKSFAVKVLDPLPVVTEKQRSKKAYDCVMNNTFRNKDVDIKVDCQKPPAELTFSKAAKNVSQGNIDASTATAKENDKLTFTISVKNTGGTAKTVELSDHLGDVLEYATLTDKGGGSYDETRKLLSWPDATVKPGATETRTFAVRVLSTIPATPTGQSDHTSYDCVIANVFEDVNVQIPVTCATPKVVESVVKELPTTGPTENLLFGGILLAVVTYFFFRSKQLGREVRLIRRDLNTGNI